MPLFAVGVVHNSIHSFHTIGHGLTEVLNKFHTGYAQRIVDERNACPLCEGHAMMPSRTSSIRGKGGAYVAYVIR